MIPDQPAPPIPPGPPTLHAHPAGSTAAKLADAFHFRGMAKNFALFLKAATDASDPQVRNEYHADLVRDTYDDLCEALACAQGLTGLVQRDRAPEAVKELRAQTRLQFGHGLGSGRLADPHGFTSTREALRLGNGPEDGEVVQVHGRTGWTGALEASTIHGRAEDDCSLRISFPNPEQLDPAYF